MSEETAAGRQARGGITVAAAVRDGGIFQKMTARPAGVPGL